MHVPASAVTLARAMSSLSRARATGVLSVRSENSVCRLAFVDGVLRAGVSNLPRALLGDMLAQQTGNDPHTLAAAFELAEFRPPAGAWLVQRGLASRDEVSEALREQLRELVRAVFCWRRHELQFDPGPAEVGVYWLREALPTEALVLSGMRAVVSGRLSFALGAGRPERLTSWGRRLLDAGALSSSERALASALARGASSRDAIAAAVSCELAYQTWRALRAFGALGARAETRADYALLLRKRGQLRRRAGAHELLDLAAQRNASSQDARRALRRLALQIHPDRFGPDAAARAVSTEVMQALTRAASVVGASRTCP